jgi:hypothetical protein
MENVKVVVCCTGCNGLVDNSDLTEVVSFGESVHLCKKCVSDFSEYVARELGTDSEMYQEFALQVK